MTEGPASLKKPPGVSFAISSRARKCSFLQVSQGRKSSEHHSIKEPASQLSPVPTPQGAISASHCSKLYHPATELFRQFLD